MPERFAGILLLTVFACTACHDQPTTPAEPIPASAPSNIPASAIMLELSRLADDTMMGRGSATANELKAANYIRNRFAGASLQSPSSGALQQFSVSSSATSQNVISTLPGRGKLQNEWIVVGAHYDHVGVRNGLIYNGADDNASGAAAVLAVAAQLAQYVRSGRAGTVDRRSIAFIEFGAEELGLVGSNFYCAHPIIPLDSTYAMVNFDMIGRLADTVWVGGLSSNVQLGNAVAARNTDQLNVAAWPGLSGGTDYYCFAKAGRPAIWFFTGLHADYHKPTDDVALVNQAGLEEITNLAHRVIVYLALTPNALN